ncbi:MAG: hypothetical protein ACXWQO_00270 [Bdellovibrionota bacterium]
MKKNDVFTFHLRKSIARGALYFLIFISMVDHAVTLIYDPEGRIERMKRQMALHAEGKNPEHAKLVASREPQSIAPCGVTKRDAPK